MRIKGAVFDKPDDPPADPPADPKDDKEWRAELAKLSSLIAATQAQLAALPKTPDNSAEIAELRAALETAQAELTELRAELRKTPTQPADPPKPKEGAPPLAKPKKPPAKPPAIEAPARKRPRGEFL